MQKRNQHKAFEHLYFWKDRIVSKFTNLLKGIDASNATRIFDSVNNLFTNTIISGIIAWVKVLKVSMPTLGNESPLSIFQKQTVIKLIEKKDSWLRFKLPRIFRDCPEIRNSALNSRKTVHFSRIKDSCLSFRKSSKFLFFVSHNFIHQKVIFVNYCTFCHLEAI